MEIEEVKVVIVEDNEPLNQAFCEIVSSDPVFNVVGAYLSAEEALKEIDFDRPQIVIMDVTLPGMDGIECTRIIKRKYPKTQILMSTVHENSEVVFDALCVGAGAYLTKNTTPEKLLKALHELLMGGAPMSINIAKMVVNSFQRIPNSVLSDRETEVLMLLAKGKSYHTIAELLFISKNTIKFHVKNIYEKLEVNSREDAIDKAEQEKII